MPVAVVSLQADNLTVEPGQSTSCQVSLANTGSIVEQFTIMVMGEGVEWIHPDPPVVSLFPGSQQTVTLNFTPPRAPTTPAGVIPFAVKIIPSNEPEESVTEEGVVTVGSFTDVGAELVPRVATGRVAGRQKLAIDSRGNTPIPVDVSALDAADALKFQIRPERLTAAPGAAHYVRVRVVPRQRFWRGPPQQKPYRVQIAPEGERAVVLEGGLTQKAVLPKWGLPLLAAVGALALLWFLVLKPTVHSIAVNANKANTAALAAQATKSSQLANQVAASQAQSSAAQQAVAALAGKKPPTTTTTSTTTTTVVLVTTVPPPVTGPSDGRLEVVSAPGSTQTGAAPAVGKGTTLQITDIVVQNISGSAGTARIQRLVPGKAPEDLLVQNLGTLTDQEFRFTTPIIFSHDQQIALRIDCQSNQTACDVGMYYTGPLTQPQSATTTTIP